MTLLEGAAMTAEMSNAQVLGAGVLLTCFGALLIEVGTLLFDQPLRFFAAHLRLLVIEIS